MSKSLNHCAFIGNVGSDPEIRTTAGGNKVATFSLATSRQWKDGRGEKQEKTEWHRMVAWSNGKSGLADIVDSYVKKGDKLYVEGSLEYSQWKDKEGQTRYTTEIRVNSIILLGGKSEETRELATAGKGPATKKRDENWDDFPAPFEDKDDSDLPF